MHLAGLAVATSDRQTRWVLAPVVVAMAVLVVGAWWVGRRTPGYSHRSRSISELGEVGAPHQRLIAFGVFLPVGALALVGGVVGDASWPVKGLAASLAVGYLVAAVAPCDAGCPTAGSTRNSIHLAAGATEYLGGAVALTAMAFAEHPAYAVPALLVIGASVALGRSSVRGHRGIVQRVAEVALFGGLAVSLI